MTPSHDSSKDGSNNPHPKSLPSRLPISLIHRVLLADSSSLSTMTSTGKPKQNVPTPSFEDFVADLGFLSSEARPTSEQRSLEDQMSRTMRRAFLASMIEQITVTTRNESRDKSNNSTADGDSSPADFAAILPLQSLILELHVAIRGLVPRRTDLHGFLDDDAVRRSILGPGDRTQATLPSSTSTEKEKEITVRECLLKAAEALSKLESVERSTTTQQWIGRTLQQSSSPSHPSYLGGMTPEMFWVTSAAYLHHKAELCQEDIQEFHFRATILPSILMNSQGTYVERTDFIRRHALSDHLVSENEVTNGGNPVQMDTGIQNSFAAELPGTVEWIRHIVNSYRQSSGENGHPELISNKNSRIQALRAVGWIDSILFRTDGSASPQQSAAPNENNSVGNNDNDNNDDKTFRDHLPNFLRLPEVLDQDLDSIRSIRSKTQRSVIGSALAWHATSAAASSRANAASNNDNTEMVDACRKKLVQAMEDAPRILVGGQEELEKFITPIVMDLAHALKTSSGPLEPTAVETLRGRVKAVLAGSDPVIKLLDNRMRDAFRAMVSFQPGNSSSAIPDSIQSGRMRDNLAALPNQEQPSLIPNRDRLKFYEAAKTEFSKRGFAFNAPDLVEACWLAYRVVSLMLTLYYDLFLDQMFLSTLRESE